MPLKHLLAETIGAIELSPPCKVLVGEWTGQVQRGLWQVNTVVSSFKLIFLDVLYQNSGNTLQIAPLTLSQVCCQTFRMSLRLSSKFAGQLKDNLSPIQSLVICPL